MVGYGTSIMLDKNRDFKFNPITNTFSLVSGPDNVVQAIEILLRTLQGELRFYPEFGVNLPQMMDKNISNDTIKHAIINAVLRDPRVKSVDKISLERDRRTLNVMLQITTYEGAILEFKEDVVW